MRPHDRCSLPWPALAAVAIGLACGEPTTDEELTPRTTPGDIAAPRPMPVPPDTPAVPGLTPLFDCIAPNEHNGITAVFGYANFTGAPAVIGLGAENHIDVPNNDRGQAVTFETGEHHHVFAVEFANTNVVVWRLRALEAIADLNGPACPRETAELTIGGDVPPLPNPAPSPDPQPPPPLAGNGDPRARAEAFVNWLGAARASQLEQARTEIEAAAWDFDVTWQLAMMVEEYQGPDWVRALLAVAVLGELRNQLSFDYLRYMAWQEPPSQGTIVGHGEVLDRMQKLGLQFKAVHGIGAMEIPESDDTLLQLMGWGSTPEIRCEAARTYRFHHDADELELARQWLHPEQWWCFDMINNALPADEFDANVEAYRLAHPELAPVSEEEVSP